MLVEQGGYTSMVEVVERLCLVRVVMAVMLLLVKMVVDMDLEEEGVAEDLGLHMEAVMEALEL
jgi:hypothetical protein